MTKKKTNRNLRGTEVGAKPCCKTCGFRIRANGNDTCRRFPPTHREGTYAAWPSVRAAWLCGEYRTKG